MDLLDKWMADNGCSGGSVLASLERDRDERHARRMVRSGVIRDMITTNTVLTVTQIDIEVARRLASREEG